MEVAHHLEHFHQIELLFQVMQLLISIDNEFYYAFFYGVVNSFLENILFTPLKKDDIVIEINIINPLMKGL